MLLPKEHSFGYCRVKAKFEIVLDSHKAFNPEGLKVVPGKELFKGGYEKPRSRGRSINEKFKF